MVRLLLCVLKNGETYDLFCVMTKQAVEFIDLPISSEDLGRLLARFTSNQSQPERCPQSEPNRGQAEEVKLLLVVPPASRNSCNSFIPASVSIDSSAKASRASTP